MSQKLKHVYQKCKYMNHLFTSFLFSPFHSVAVVVVAIWKLRNDLYTLLTNWIWSVVWYVCESIVCVSFVRLLLLWRHILLINSHRNKIEWRTFFSAENKNNYKQKKMRTEIFQTCTTQKCEEPQKLLYCVSIKDEYKPSEQSNPCQFIFFQWLRTSFCVFFFFLYPCIVIHK